MSDQKLKQPKTETIKLVDPRALVEHEDFNQRHDYGDIDELKDSIVMHGVQQPLLVRTEKDDPNKFKVIDGHRRLKAIHTALENGEDPGFIPTREKSRDTNDEDDFFSQIHMNNGKPFSTLEQGEVFKTLVKKGYDKPKIAELACKSDGHVQQALNLANAPRKIKDLIIDGVIAPTTAVPIIKDESMSDEEKVEMIQSAADEKGVSSKKETENDQGDGPDDQEEKEGKKRGPSKRVTKKDLYGNVDPVKKMDRLEDVVFENIDEEKVDMYKMVFFKEVRRGIKENWPEEKMVDLFLEGDHHLRTTAYDQDEDEESGGADDGPQEGDEQEKQAVNEEEEGTNDDGDGDDGDDGVQYFDGKDENQIVG